MKKPFILYSIVHRFFGVFFTVFVNFLMGC